MKRRPIKLSEHFNFITLIRFTLPSIIMLVFTSVYGVVDGFFVSNFAGKAEFTAVNFIMPFLMALGSVGFMLGAGGSALIAKFLGEGNGEKANRVFSFLVYISVAVGAVLCGVGIAVIRPVARLLGADGELLDNCVLYGRIILIALPAFILQYEFQCLFATAERPKLGLYVTLASGLTNFALDALFIAVFKWGLVGAASATALGQVVGGVLPVIYFARKNGSLLRLGKCGFEGRALIKAVANGSSELLSNISMSIVGMLYNLQLMHYSGEDGVAAYGVLMYVGFVFVAVFIGYSVGVAPIVSYNYGAKAYDELKALFVKNLIVISVTALVMFGTAELLGGTISRVFVGYDEGLLSMTKRAFGFYSFSFLFAGFSIFGSSFFTALNSGLFSATISFLRALVFPVIAVFALPPILNLDGIWLSIVAAEVPAALISACLLFCNRRRFHYFDKT